MCTPIDSAWTLSPCALDCSGLQKLSPSRCTHTSSGMQHGTDALQGALRLTSPTAAHFNVPGHQDNEGEGICSGAMLTYSSGHCISPTVASSALSVAAGEVLTLMLPSGITSCPVTAATWQSNGIKTARAARGHSAGTDDVVSEPEASDSRAMSTVYRHHCQSFVGIHTSRRATIAAQSRCSFRL